MLRPTQGVAGVLTRMIGHTNRSGLPCDLQRESGNVRNLPTPSPPKTRLRDRINVILLFGDHAATASDKLDVNVCGSGYVLSELGLYRPSNEKTI